uniref:Uncharacterized protein n=1 Tax=Eutreptiella gymnastica TaxID=73025 RepID=A0A7S1NL82_9EUGL
MSWACIHALNVSFGDALLQLCADCQLIGRGHIGGERPRVLKVPHSLSEGTWLILQHACMHFRMLDEAAMRTNTLQQDNTTAHTHGGPPQGREPSPIICPAQHSGATYEATQCHGL